MTHLRDSELVDLLDGTLAASRAAHLHTCDACRSASEELRDTLTMVASTPVDEPSPLFWERFPERVSKALDAPAPLLGWLTGPRLALAALATVTIVLVGLMLMSSASYVGAPAPSSSAVATVADPVTPLDDLETDADWAVVRAAADGLELDDAQAAGLVARPGTADRMAMDLTDAERAELIRLLEAEFKTGA